MRQMVGEDPSGLISDRFSQVPVSIGFMLLMGLFESLGQIDSIQHILRRYVFVFDPFIVPGSIQLENPQDSRRSIRPLQSLDDLIILPSKVTYTFFEPTPFTV